MSTERDGVTLAALYRDILDTQGTGLFHLMVHAAAKHINDGRFDAMGLTEFLTARLDEDEAAANRLPDYLGGGGASGGPSGSGGAWLFTTRVRLLREVAAKRAILAAYEGADDTVVTQMYSPDYYGLGDAALEALAAVYSDHPDFDPAWKPEGAQPWAGKQ